MDCFTIIDFRDDHHYFDTKKSFIGIPVINDGIGLDGKLAKLADDIIFPKPNLEDVTQDSFIPPFGPAPKQFIQFGKFFHYKGYGHFKDNGHDEKTFTPIIYDDGFDFEGTLALLIVQNRESWDITKIRTDEESVKLVLGPTEVNGYTQYLYHMYDNEHRDTAIYIDHKIINEEVRKRDGRPSVINVWTNIYTHHLGEMEYKTYWPPVVA